MRCRFVGLVAVFGVNEPRDGGYDPVRAPREESVATTGQYRVQGQFSMLGWGSLPNPYHDLGTDLVLLPRDLTNFDVGLPLGAQVKTSENKRGSGYFREPVRRDGQVTGWWFRESNRKHFDYWLRHALPHVVILHDIETQESYWVHVVEHDVKPTGKGAKIFVPADQTVDKAHFDALHNVAASKPRGPSWEGSAWSRQVVIPPEAALRYALLTPRLVAPHRNDTPESVEPQQAIAMVIQCRFSELDDRRQMAQALGHLPQSPYPSPEDAGASPDARWQLYAALHRYVKSGDNGRLISLIEKVEEPDIRAATVAAASASLIEVSRPHEALQILHEQQANGGFSTVDAAWLDMHRARCLAELGRIEEAQKIAIRLQDLRPIFTSDPTAMAVAASATVLIFTSTPWSNQVSDAITHTDTVAAWWRSQEIAWGLDRMLDSSFATWTQEGSPLAEIDSRVVADLRTASLLSGFAADQSGWRDAYARVSKYLLQSATRFTNTAVLVTALTGLRVAGEDDELVNAATRLVQDGPARVVRELGEAVEFRSSTVTTSLADIKLVTEAADLLPSGSADYYAKWSLKTLSDSAEFREQVQPSYVVRHYVLQMLRKLVSACSKPMRRNVIRTILNLPAITDPGDAHDYAAVLTNIRLGDWTSAHIQTARNRKKDDRLFSDPLSAILSQHDAGVRRKLLTRARRGEAQAIVNVGDVSLLPPEVAIAQIAAQSKLVSGQIEAARSGQFAFGTYSPSHALALLNIHHPTHANWTPVVGLMMEPRSHPKHLQRAVTTMRDHADQISPAQRAPIVAALRLIVSRTFPLWVPDQDALKLAAREALDALDDAPVPDADLWRLMEGGAPERQSLAHIIGARSSSGNLGILALLSHDQNSGVRAVAARWLSRWMIIGTAADECYKLVVHLAGEAGTLVPTVIADELRAYSDDMLAESVMALLSTHISGTIRLLATGEK
jgi:hypothetical protein